MTQGSWNWSPIVLIPFRYRKIFILSCEILLKIMILGSFLTYLDVFEVKNNENGPIDLNFDTGNRNNI